MHLCLTEECITSFAFLFCLHCLSVWFFKFQSNLLIRSHPPPLSIALSSIHYRCTRHIHSTFASIAPFIAPQPPPTANN